MSKSNAEKAGRFLNRRRVVIALVALALLACPCTGLVFLFGVPREPSCTVTIDGIEVSDRGQIELDYHYARSRSASIGLVLDGTEFPKSGGVSSPFSIRQKGSKGIQFHVNHSYRTGPVEEWAERVLVKEGEEYEVTATQPLTLYNFEEDGVHRIGQIVVE